MPSYFYGGLAQGLEKPLEEMRKKREESRKPTEVLKGQIAKAIAQAAMQPTQPQMQEQADILESGATPGVPLDLQSAIASTQRGQAFSDEGKRAGDFLSGLQNLGIGGVSSEGITFKNQYDLGSLFNLPGIEGLSPKRVTRGGVTYEAPPVPRKASSSQVASIQETQNSIRQIEDLISKFESNPDIGTGPTALPFRRQGVLSKVGNIKLQYGTPPEEAKRVTELSRLANRAQDQYRRAVTASQAGFPEIQFLQTSFASPERETRENLIASYKVALDDLRAKKQGMIDILGQSGYEISGFGQSNQQEDNDPLGIR